LCGFDCLIILLQDTLGEEEVKFAQAALKYSMRVMFVRSRCDLDFHKIGEENTDPTQEDVQDLISRRKTKYFSAYLIGAFVKFSGRIDNHTVSLYKSCNKYRPLVIYN
jgi:hypothetical protein